MSKTPTMPPPGRILYSVNETAAVMGLGENTVYELTERAGFPVLKFGSLKKIPARALDRWIEEQLEAQMTPQK
ncbi:MAG TPA: helix-turn-helix domain-containing protein [Candidatus Onthomonas avicola]|nr:helix-turn-helix domain-containing protein [Candidatus Onthomonas avicola]